MEPETASVQVNEGRLSCVGQDLKLVPPWLQTKYGDLTSVDLSYNGITVLDSLEGFTKLESLVVDSNCLEAKQDRLPRIPTLTTLCVNDNNIVDIDQWLTCVATCFPSLTYLSMLKNPACPNYFIGKDQQDYARYRLFVLHRLPGLKFLDSSPVTAQERAEAKRVGHLMRVARPSEEAQSPTASAPSVEPTSDAAEDEEDALQAPGRGKASYGVSRYVYQGKQSEGNRFILNEDL